MEQSQTVEISKCFESPTNPRGALFEATSQKDLEASIREKGVLMPILVRLVKGKYEVIAGNRRLRAAKAVGLFEIPARVTSMNDTEVREAQIVENMQRADVHPLEEGTAYRELIEHSKPRYEIADVALKVGKSETYVRDRLFLTNLIPSAQKAFRSGVIQIGHAVLIARLSPKVQKEALNLCSPSWSSDTDKYDGLTDMSVRRLREWIQEQSYKDVASAPWKDDEALNAAYAGCDECKGKGGDLFGKKASEACSNPKCYIARALAYVELKRREEPELALISLGYGRVEPFGPTKLTVHSASEYDEVQGKEKKNCTGATRAIVVEGEGIGQIKTVCWASDCPVHQKSYRTNYHKSPEEKARATAERKKEIAAATKKREKDQSATEEAVAKLSWPLSEKHLSVILDLALSQASHDILQGICKRRVLEAKKYEHSNGRDYRGALGTFAASLKSEEKTGLLFELLLPSYSPHYNDRSKWTKRM